MSRGRRYSSNIVAQARWWMSAVGVRTPSRSNRTAANESTDGTDRNCTARTYGGDVDASRHLWGAQTELAVGNFPIARRPLDVRVAHALATIKRHAAAVNAS